jgi:hypothetical protein
MASTQRESIAANTSTIVLSPSSNDSHTLVIVATTGSTPFEISSLDGTNVVQEGFEIGLVNDGSKDVVLKHNDGSGVAGFLLIFRDGLDRTLPAGGMLWGKFLESSTQGRNGWRLHKAFSSWHSKRR